ncbi:MAG: hypothetical protein LIO47_03860, partial [Akkermansia sp.]|nr:hypothetical protein [Akkermansia sp.]
VAVPAWIRGCRFAAGASGGTAEACLATVFPTGDTAVCFSGYIHFLDSFNIFLFLRGVLLGCFCLRNQMTNL